MISVINMRALKITLHCIFFTMHKCWNRFQPSESFIWLQSTNKHPADFLGLNPVQIIKNHLFWWKTVFISGTKLKRLSHLGHLHLLTELCPHFNTCFTAMQRKKKALRAWLGIYEEFCKHAYTNQQALSSTRISRLSTRPGSADVRLKANTWKWLDFLSQKRRFITTYHPAQQRSANKWE